ncbi:3-deoxy-manno-octulosonate cytidylyltransferase [bacterium]|nr:3-deoxy-manno-octulosonate cytidylyltransferase [bacterium]
MTTVAVIPARYASTRFPGKPLADLAGKPLVLHVVDRAREARTVDDVLVATDDDRIAEVVRGYGVKVAMTSPECPSGTDRIAQAVADMPEAEIIVNVQGDEPLMPPDVIDLAVEALKGDWECSASTAMIRLRTEQDYLSPHIVKVVCDPDGRALYFSRSPLPSLVRATPEDMGVLKGTEGEPFWGFKHFGLYVYRRDALFRYVQLPPSPLERIEKLEQLRFLENNMRIRVVETNHDSRGVDTPEDLETAKKMMRNR